MHKILRPVTLIPSLFILAASLQGAATRIAFVDPFATARGNAFTATADNASALFYTAAGLTQLEGTSVQANIFAISLAYEYDSAFGSDSMDDGFQAVPSFFGAHKFADLPIAIGFGTYAPFALGSDWGSGASFTNPLFGGQLVPYKADLAYIKYHTAIAWQVTDTLSVAAGISYDDSDVDLKATALEFDGEDDTLGYSLSVLWKPSEEHAFGLNYQAKTELTYAGAANVLVAPNTYVPLPATADLIFPESIVFGYAYTPNEDWNFEFNVDWTNWDRVNALTLSGVPGATYALNWESAFIWEVGFTRYFDQGWYFSGGYTYVENAVPDADFLPIVPDSDRHFFAVGIGRSYETINWQFTIQQAVASDRKVTGNTFPTVNGSWDLDSTAFSFSVGYQF